MDNFLLSLTEEFINVLYPPLAYDLLHAISFIALVIAVVQLIRLRQQTRDSNIDRPNNDNVKFVDGKIVASPDNTRMLDILLVVLLLAMIIGGSIVAAIWIIASTCQGVSCGDFIFTIFLPVGVIGSVSFAYLAFDIRYFISQSKHQQPIAKRHMFGVLIGLIVPIGVLCLYLYILSASA